VSRGFLRYPVEFSRISSGFSSARFHPILKTWRAHNGIDYAAPVLAIQRQLLDLRRTYIIGGMLIGLPWWFLTAPLLVALSRGAILEQAPSVIWLQLLIGAAGLLATWWFHRWANRPQRAAFGRKLDDGAAGGSIRRAQAALDEIAEFERD